MFVDTFCDCLKPFDVRECSCLSLSVAVKILFFQNSHLKSAIEYPGRLKYYFAPVLTLGVRSVCVH